MKTAKKVLLIDPWGVNASGEYLNGLIYGLSQKAELTVFTNTYFKFKTNADCKLYKIFFARSENMKDGIKRKAVRGLEYMTAYSEILKYLKKHSDFDIIHINWLLMYKLDIHLLPMLKKHCKKLVYTAHNVLPHMNGERHIHLLSRIYKIADVIILHGEGIKKEFDRYFPECTGKVYIQKHGADLFSNTAYDIEKIDPEIVRKLNGWNIKFIYLGYMYYNKGTDRLVSIWNEMPSNVLLIMAGKINGVYEKLEKQREIIRSMDNILFLDYFIPDNLANYLISQSDLVLVPYRHASMSGVVFTAADFAKPVWATDTGAMKEYLDEDSDFLVENNIESMKTSLKNIAREFSAEEMKKRGVSHNKHITSHCSWITITKKLYNECYIK